VRTNEKSGAIFVNASVIKNTVSSVWEAELMAASDAIDTIKYLQNVGRELMYPLGSQCSLRVDNESVVNWIYGNNISISSKHVEIKLFKLRHFIQLGSIEISHIGTEENVSDLLTKSLARIKFLKFRSQLMGHELVEGYDVRGVD
jgi:hypothetical protein